MADCALAPTARASTNPRIVTFFMVVSILQFEFAPYNGSSLAWATA